MFGAEANSVGVEPDKLIGMFDTAELAAIAVTAMNRRDEPEGEVRTSIHEHFQDCWERESRLTEENWRLKAELALPENQRLMEIRRLENIVSIQSEALRVAKQLIHGGEDEWSIQLMATIEHALATMRSEG